MARSETVGSLRAYFLLAATIGAVANVAALLQRPLGLTTLFALGGLAIAGAFAFLGVRLETLIVASPRLCQQIVIAAGALLVLMAAVSFALTRSAMAAAQMVFGLLIAWYLLTNVRRLAKGDHAVRPPSPRSLALSRAAGWAAVGVAGIGVVATLVFIAPVALDMASSASESTDYIACAFLVLMPLLLCAVPAYFGIRMLRSARRVPLQPESEAAAERSA